MVGSMDGTSILWLLLIVFCAAISFGAGYLLRTTRTQQDDLAAAAQLTMAQQKVAALEADLLRHEGQVAALRAAQAEQTNTHHNTNDVLETLAPMQHAISKLEHQLATVRDQQHKHWSGYQHGLNLTQQAHHELRQTTEALRQDTTKLAGALTSSQARGQWGELQLRRVTELAGMKEHIDIDFQVTVDSDSPATGGKTKKLRPDAVVRLPDDQCIVIDAKAPMNAYLDSLNEADPRPLLAKHGNDLLRHVTGLAQRGYSDAIAGSANFVVCFVPNDSVLSAAMDAKPTLLDEALKHNILLCSPSSLMAVLRSTAMVWQQDQLTRETQAIIDCGKELSQRAGHMSANLTDVGKALDKAVSNYNKLVTNSERSFFSKAREFNRKSGNRQEITEPGLVDRHVRPLTSPQWQESSPDLAEHFTTEHDVLTGQQSESQPATDQVPSAVAGVPRAGELSGGQVVDLGDEGVVFSDGEVAGGG